MQHPNRIGTRQFVAACFVILSLRASGAEPDSQAQLPCAYAIVPFGTAYRVDEKIPLALVVVNGGEETIYVKDILWPVLEVRDATGQVLRDTREALTPPPVPPTHIMRREGRPFIVSPVDEVPPMQSFTRVFPDPLESYRSRLKPGNYSVRLRVNRIAVYAKAQVIIRKGLDRKHWIKAGIRPTYRPAWPGSIEIELLPAKTEER